MREQERGLPWEVKVLGADVQTRISAVGKTALDLQSTSTPEKNKDLRIVLPFTRRVHTWGQHILQMMHVDDDKSFAKDKHIAAAKTESNAARVRLRRKNIRVAENEDSSDALGLKVDKEWNTSGWSDTMLQDGIKCLFEIFYDSGEYNNDAKELACTMLVKLVNRHPAADDYVRQNIGQLAALAANRFLRGGKSAGILDLLHIIHACKERYIFELSDCMFCFRVFLMMGLELQLAATLIQHMFRRWHYPRKRQKRASLGTVLPITLTFGEEEELLRNYDEAIFKRTKELKARWNTMHIWMHRLDRVISVGCRGPAYIGTLFSHICLDIIRVLVSDGIVPPHLANANREDVVRSCGCEFLSLCIGCVLSPFAPVAANILANVAKIPDSLPYVLGGGCIDSCVAYISMLLGMNRIGFLFAANPDRSLDALSKADRERHPVFVAKMAFFDCLNCIAHSSMHAAGVFRARSGYDYIKNCDIIGEEINYLKHYEIMLPVLRDTTIPCSLGSPKLLSLLFLLVRTSLHLNTVRLCLRILCALSGSECHRAVLSEACLEGGANLKRIVDLLEDQDVTVNSLSLTLLLQLNCVDYGRHKLMFVNIPSMIYVAIKPRDNFMNGPYLRSLLATASCLRQHKWRAYEPMLHPLRMTDLDCVRNAIYVDLLKTITSAAELDGSDTLSIADLIVLPIDWNASHELSIVAESIGALELSYWMVQPSDKDYFSRLPWDEGVAGCVILDVLSSHGGTLENMYSVRMANYLGQCLHLSRFLFGPKKEVTERQAQVVLTGVKSAATVLGRMCAFSRTDSDRSDLILSIRGSDLLSAAHFFVDVLGAKDSQADKAITNLKVQTGLSVLKFYTQYAQMVCDMQSVSDAKQDELLRELCFAGKSASNLLRTARLVFGATPRTQYVLSTMCDLLVILTKKSLSFPDVAITEWNIFTSLRENLPAPVSRLDPDIIDTPEFKYGLGLLPASYFRLVSALCLYDPGKRLALNEGILKRALEVVTVLTHHRLRCANNGRLPERRVVIEGSDLSAIDTPEPDNGTTYADKMDACLRLVACLGTFSAPGTHSANDLILLPQFGLVNNCQLILSEKLYNKKDCIVTAALCVFASLARDSRNVCDEGQIFQELDVLGTLNAYLQQAGNLDDAAVQACLSAVQHVISVPTNYVTKCLQKLVSPLTRVNRIKPAFNKQVLDIVWAIALRLNSFSLEQMDTRNAEAVDSDEEPDFANASAFTEDMRRALEDDSILAKQLNAIFKEAKVNSVGRIKHEKLLSTHKSSSLGAPSPEALRVGNEREWHNPTFEQAKEMSSPQEVRHRNFVTDMLARAGYESPHTPQSSPHSLEAFRNSSYGAALHAEIKSTSFENDAAQYCLMYNECSASQTKVSPTNVPLFPHVPFRTASTSATETDDSRHFQRVTSLPALVTHTSSPKSFSKLSTDLGASLASLPSPASHRSSFSSPSSQSSPQSVDKTDLFFEKSSSPAGQALSAKPMLSHDQLKQTFSPESPKVTTKSVKLTKKNKSLNYGTGIQSAITEIDLQDVPELLMTRPKGAMIHIV